MAIELKHAIAVLPVKDVKAAVAFYKDKLGFVQAFEQGDYAGIMRGPIEIHLDGYAKGQTPVRMRINLSGVDDIHAEAAPKGIIDPEEPLKTMPWGMRQFTVLDLDGNRITFAQPGV